MMENEPSDSVSQNGDLQTNPLKDRNLIIVSNRGPVTFQMAENGEMSSHRGGGGLVTALTGLVQQVGGCWIACAMTDADRSWGQGALMLTDGGGKTEVRFISPDLDAYDGYYNVIANPLLWFLQHSMWDLVRSPTINYNTWQAWEKGYVEVNRLFASEVVEEILKSDQPSMVMLQDYHLYLAPLYIQRMLRNRKPTALSFFVHIPWPGAEDWGMLPAKMRHAILEGLCAVDLLGFQTREDGLNFIRTVESHLPRCHVNFKRGRVWYRNHATHIRDFPISIDVDALRRLAESSEVEQYRKSFENRFGDKHLIVRIDRTEPSKNIVRGFQAFDEMLDLHPEHKGKVQFLALLVPSRLEVNEYQNYLDELMAAAGRVNARHGDSEWEPVRILVGENYPRAIAALQIYDVLLVNSIADGMNLVAKEGPVVNQKHGVVILSERTGARQQLESGALVISPCDVYATAEALHQSLIMPMDERELRANRLQTLVEQEDIAGWLHSQLDVIEKLHL